MKAKPAVEQKIYLIMAFKSYGLFYCTEEPQTTKEVFLRGKFNNTKGEYTFIKHPNDILITTK